MQPIWDDIYPAIPKDTQPESIEIELISEEKATTKVDLSKLSDEDVQIIKKLIEYDDKEHKYKEAEEEKKSVQESKERATQEHKPPQKQNPMPKPGIISNSPQDAFMRGWNAMGKKDYELAISYCTTAIKLDPKFADAYSLRGLSYWKMGDSDKAIVDCNKAIRLNPKGGQSYRIRGEAYKQRGEMSKAEPDLEEARRLGF